MPKIAVVDMEGKEVGTVDLSESVFGIEPNMAVMKDVVVNHLANLRQGTQSALTRSVKRLAMKSALSSKLLGSDIIVLDSLDMEEYKTKSMVRVLGNIGAEGKALIVLPEIRDMIIKSARNIPGVKTSQVGGLNVYDILNAKKLVILKDSISKIEEVYA